MLKLDQIRQQHIMIAMYQSASKNLRALLRLHTVIFFFFKSLCTTPISVQIHMIPVAPV